MKNWIKKLIIARVLGFSEENLNTLIQAVTFHVNFYQVSLISDCFDERIESAVFDYILNHNSGIYYIYDSCLSVLPETFESKKASHYPGAIELLAEYKKAKAS